MTKVFLLFFCVIVSSACTQEYNPDLRGQWQLQTRITNKISYTVDTVFYAFDSRIVCKRVRVSPLECKELFMEFTQISDSLILVSVDDTAVVKPSERYKIEELTAQKLRLKSVSSELIFRKF